MMGLTRWIIAVLCVLFLGGTSPVWAGTVSLEQGEAIAQKAITASDQGNFAQAEEYWTQLIEAFPENPAVWSNRGNSRMSQNHIQEAIADYNQAIQLTADVPDPYLNRGIAYERLQQWQQAIADYEKVLEIDPNDPMAYNNRGNAQAGQGNWSAALTDYKKATELAPNFAFAFANYALALYQSEQNQEALQLMRTLVRKYPMFPDIRAALTAVLWEQGQQGEAESNWVAAVGMDHRYQDIEWVTQIRRWPPKMIAALEKFLKLE